MTFYALRTTKAERQLHRFPSKARRDWWVGNDYTPEGEVGHREAITSRHERVQDLYDGRGTVIDHTTETVVPKALPAS